MREKEIDSINRLERLSLAVSAFCHATDDLSTMIYYEAKGLNALAGGRIESIEKEITDGVSLLLAESEFTFKKFRMLFGGK